MVPEILIVGDDVRRDSLVRRVSALGYAVQESGAAELPDALTASAAPAAILVCAAGADAAALMAQLRRSRHGAAIPVTLCGRLGGAIRDLADVLDLGADHFLEEPVGDDALLSALEALAGPASPAPRRVAVPQPVSLAETGPLRTEVISEAGIVSPASSTGSLRDGGRSGGDPSIGQLGRTLDMLEEKMRARGETPPADSADDLELSMLGLDDVPDVDSDAGLDDLGSDVAVANPLPRSSAGRESTMLLETSDASVEPQTSTGERSGSWRDFSSGSVVGTSAHDATASRVLHDRPRRATPLTVDEKGDLMRVEVPRLLWKLHRAHFTGRLVLRRGRVEKRLWFDNGRIGFARSNIGYDRLIDGLLRRGLLSRDQYGAARRLAAKEPGRAGRLLVESGFLKETELAPAIREHLLRIVDSTFPWNEGTWELHESERCDESVRLDRPAAEIVLSGVAFRMESAQLWALLGGLRQHPRLRGDARDVAAELGLPAESESLLVALDGRASLGGLTKGAYAGEQPVLALVYALHVMGLVELSAEPPPEASTALDPAELDRARVVDRLAIVRECDYFLVLGLSRSAGAVDVRRAESELMTTFGAGAIDPRVEQELAVELSELRIAVKEAASILVDDDLRNAYLAHLEAE